MCSQSDPTTTYLFRLPTLHLTSSPGMPPQQKALSRDLMPSTIQHFPLPKEVKLDSPEHQSQSRSAPLSLARKKITFCPQTSAKVRASSASHDAWAINILLIHIVLLYAQTFMQYKYLSL